MVPIDTQPTGADVYIRDYADDRNTWEYLGKTPLKENRLPGGFYAFKLSKEGYEIVETTGSGRSMNVSLDPTGSLQGEWRVSAGNVHPTSHHDVDLDTFLIDKFEVTNRDYKKFMDAGGYRDPKYWKTHSPKMDARSILRTRCC